MRTALVIALLAGMLASSRVPAAADASRPRLVVVVGKTSRLESVSLADLRRMYGGSQVSLSGQRIVPFNHQPSTPERTYFDRVVLGMSPQQVGRYWIDRKVRGESSAPRSLPSAGHVAKVVAKFPGAIGYLRADQVTADLRVLAIDGIPPGERGYPLEGE